MKTMVAAKNYAIRIVDVDLFAVKYDIQHVVFKPGFKWLPVIQKYAYDYITKI